MALVQSFFIVLALFGFYASAQKGVYKCDFEQRKICSFLSNDRNNRENWKIGTGKANSADTGPSVDHTLGNENGSYAFVNVTAAKTYDVKLQTSTLKSDYCVRFFYHMYGADVGDLTVQTLTVYSRRVTNFFRRSQTQGDRWKEASFSVTMDRTMKSNGYNVIFYAKHKTSSNFRGDIALDDVELTPGKCPDTKREADQLCTFDDYDCGFYLSDRTTRLQWYWQSAASSAVYFATKPSTDHTLGTNYGGYWFASSKTTSGLEKTFLNSPPYPAPKETLNCLHFYYYMNANQSSGYLWWLKDTKEAYLQVNVKSDPNTKTWITTKGKNITTNLLWHYAEAKVEISKPFNLQFVAAFDTSVEALIAIDDVKLFPGNCPEAGYCDFEQNKCTWIDGDGDFTWVRKSGNSYVNRIDGPKTDMTLQTGDGHYIVISPDGLREGVEANLESELFPPSNETLCLSFYFYMSGNEVGTLKVVRKEENITETTVWLVKDDPVENWRKAMAPLRPSDFYNQVVLRGIVGRGKQGFIAVDNLRFRKGEKCDISPTMAEQRIHVSFVLLM